MKKLFLEVPSPEDGKTFNDLNEIENFWNYVGEHGPLLGGLYWDKWYNNETFKFNEEQKNLIFYENKLLGVPRLRQVRVRNGTCTIHADFKNEIKSCYSEYNIGNQETATFGDSNNPAFSFKTEKELAGSSFYSPTLGATYDGSGYVQNLANTLEESKEIISKLKQYKWLDRQTRAVFIDFTVYNANVNLFCVIRLVLEFPATGGVITTNDFRSVKMIGEENFYEKFLEISFLFMVYYYLVEELIEITEHGREYLRHFWNIFDVLILALSIVLTIFRFYRAYTLNFLLGNLQQIWFQGSSSDSNSNQGNHYPDFEFVSYLQVRYVYGAAFLVFFGWVKLFKYLSFNSTMKQLQVTLERCLSDITGFAVMFGLVLLAFTQLGYMVFGQVIYKYSTPAESFYTLFRIILGDFDFHEMEQAHYIIGPAYFISYVFIVFFILLNMFLAIINDTYSLVKEELSNQGDDLQVTDYIMRKLGGRVYLVFQG